MMPIVLTQAEQAFVCANEAVLLDYYFNPSEPHFALVTALRGIRDRWIWSTEIGHDDTLAWICALRGLGLVDLWTFGTTWFVRFTLLGERLTYVLCA